MPEKLFPVCTSQLGAPVKIIIIGYPSGSLIEGAKLKVDPTWIVWSGSGVIVNVGVRLITIILKVHVAEFRVPSVR